MLNKIAFKIPIVFHSRPYKAVAAGIVLFSSRKFGLPLSLRKVVKASKLKTKIVNRCIMKLKSIIPETNRFVARPVHFLEPITTRVNSDQTTKELSKILLERIEAHPVLSGEHPTTIASCAIFLASLAAKGKNLLIEIATAAETSKTTIRNLYANLYPYRFDLFRNIRFVD